MRPMKVHLGEFLMIKWIKNMIYTMNNQLGYVSEMCRKIMINKENKLTDAVLMMFKNLKWPIDTYR